jgi:cullin 4
MIGIQQSGLIIIHDVSDNNNTTVISILAFKKTMDQIVKESFRYDSMFLDALKDSFTSFLNFQPNKAAEIIAKFVDSKLRNSSKVMAVLVVFCPLFESANMIPITAKRIDGRS